MADYSGLLKEIVPNMGSDTKKPGAGLFEEAGIWSPSEKIQRRLEQQQAMQAQFALQQQLAAQAQSMQLAQAGAKANAPTGFNFAPFMAMGGLQNIQAGDRIANQATRASQPSPSIMSRPINMQGQPAGGLPTDVSDAAGISPEKIITEALQKYPTRSQAAKVAGAQLAALGQARNDPYLQNIGANLINKSADFEKDEAEIENKKASTAKTKVDTTKAEGELNNPGNTFQGHSPDGDLVTMAPQFENGKFAGYKVVTKGPNKQITQTVDDPRTGTQKGEEYQNFQKLLVNSEAALTSMQDIASGLEQGAGIGWAGKGVQLLDNAIGTMEQIAPNAKLSSKAVDELMSNDGKFQEWAKKTGIEKSRISDLVSNLAKTYNPTGTITEKDIARAAEAVGGGLSNPKTMAAVLQDAGMRSARFVDQTYKYMGKDAADASKSQYEKFKGTWGGEYPQTKAEYDALKDGTRYWNPQKGKFVTKGHRGSN